MSNPEYWKSQKYLREGEKSYGWGGLIRATDFSIPVPLFNSFYIRGFLYVYDRILLEVLSCRNSK